MKLKVLPTILFALSALCLPAQAHCPLAKDDPKPAPKKKAPTVVVTHHVAPEPEPFWHDLHWFE